MTRTLRPWQAEAIARVREEWAKGNTRTAVVAATGLGKSSVIAKMAVDEAEAGGHALLLAHRAELLDQMRDTCHLFNPSIPVGRIQAGTDQRGFPITVAMAPTLGNRARRARITRRPTLVIVDECHRAANDTYRAILEWAGCFEGTRTLGVTATLVRGDKRKLSSVWQSVALERDIVWGVEQGLLVPPRGKVVAAAHMDLSKAKVSRGDYQDGDLGEMVEQSTDEIVKAWQSYAADKLTVAFVPTVASAHALADEFAQVGVAAEVVTGDTDQPTRRGIFRRLREGTTRVVVNVFVLVEGWDEPRIECVLWARPTRLPGVYTQGVGRGLRLCPEIGKTEALILDVVGASRGQRLVGLTDLSEAFEVDRSELDALPCEDCGGFKPKAVAADPELAPCSCEREQGPGRDPDGGRLRLQGPARYEDIPLLPDPKARHRWLRSRRGVPFLIGSLPWCTNRAGIVYPDTGHADSPTWTPGHVAVRGRTSWTRLAPADGCMTFETAQLTVQAWAGPSPRVPSGPAPEWLVGKAATFGVEQAWRLDRRALQDAIDVARVSAVVDR